MMRTSLLLLSCVGVGALGACKDKDHDDVADTARVAADTTVRERTVKDTMIVTHDTTIHTDTVVKLGGVPATAVPANHRPKKP